MPSKKAAAEWLAEEVRKGRGDESCHIVDVAAEQAERIKNNKRKTRFVLCCDDPDLCSSFEREKNRIFLRVKNKAIMLSLMIMSWERALSDAELNKIMAEYDKEEHIGG
jgi:hypothetical protein